jgi:hypothetical protein
VRQSIRDVARVYNRHMQRWLVSLALSGIVIGACGKAPPATPSPEPPEPRSSASIRTTESPDGPRATQASTCQDDAAFLADLTLPDGTQAAPGERLDKQWSVRNTGSCDWGPDYRLVPILPNPLAGEDPVALYPARSGTQAVWQVTIEVPDTSGEVIGRWQAQSPDGVAFGQEVYVVLDVSPATVAPTSESSPTP